MMTSNEGSQAGRSWQVFAGSPPVPAEHTGSSPVAQEIASAGPIGRTGATPAVQAQGRSRKADLVEFRRALFSATPHVVTTPILAVACVAVYGLMVVSGVPWMWPSGAQLIRWGANEGARIILRHEYWRLIAMAFVHGGLIHLLVNMSSLLVIGPLVERLYGSLTFGIIYLVAGIGGALASVGSSPLRVSVGASGAICGVLGALFAFLLVHRRTVPMSVRKPLLVNILATIVFMAVLGAIVPNIDQEAHLGGLLTGFVCGALLARPWPVVRRRSTSVRRLAATVAIAAALAAAVVTITRTGVGALPTVSKFQDLAAQLAPALDEYNAILEAMPSTLALACDRDEQTERPRHAQRIDELIVRAQVNRSRMQSAVTPDPALRAIKGDVVRAQDEQLNALLAQRAYLETGNREQLSGPDGVRERRIAASRAIQAFQEHQQNYLNKSGFVVRPTQPKP
jgi:rhomboid protease GluP